MMPLRLLALPLLLASLGACNAAGSIAGAAAGIASGAATANPAVGYAVSVTVEAATDASIKYVMRELTDREQHTIAEAAGRLEVGQVATWRSEHSLPFAYADAKGTVEPLRRISSPLTECREVAIRVGEGGERRTFISTACKEARGWRWATAEPAVSRWGVLQ